MAFVNLQPGWGTKVKDYLSKLDFSFTKIVQISDPVYACGSCGMILRYAICFLSLDLEILKFLCRLYSCFLRNVQI